MWNFPMDSKKKIHRFHFLTVILDKFICDELYLEDNE